LRWLSTPVRLKSPRDPAADLIRGGTSGLVCLLAASTFCCGAVAQQLPSDVVRSGQFVQRSGAQEATSPVDFETDEPFSGSYVGADINMVINQILGEFLRIDFTIAPDVGGVMTLRVENLRSRLAAIDALRTALAPMGIAVIDRGDLVAVARATGQGGPVQAGIIDPGQPSPPGGGVVILTPRHITPSQLSPLVAPFAPSASVVIADDARRLMLVRGDEASITAISKAAALFDVDWFGQISVATFDLRNVTPQQLARDLKPLIGPMAASVDLVPVPRLSKLVVLARDPQVIAPIRGWVERLDVSSTSLSPGVLVYRARNASAEDLAKALRDSGDGSQTGSATQGAGATAAPTPVIAAPAGSPPLALLPGNSSANEQTGGSFSVSSNASQNAVIVRGNADQLAEARGLLEALDLPTPQVLIEAAIIEVTLDNDLQFGVNWRGIEDRFRGVFTDSPNGQVTSSFPGFALTYVNTDIEVALNLLASITKVEVISRPSLVALNNETATLQVGDQVPIVTQTAISVTDPDAPIVNQTEYRDTGVILKVVPHVRASGMVEIEVSQEVSQVARTTSSGIDSPTIQQRKIESRLLVPSGQSVALGGLISTTHSTTSSGIPLLMDIPLLGQLFRSDNDVVERTELIVLVTPRVLLDGPAAVEATDELRQIFRKLEQRLAPQ
jgi:general secretion pathway protein D